MAAASCLRWPQDKPCHITILLDSVTLISSRYNLHALPGQIARCYQHPSSASVFISNLLVFTTIALITLVSIALVCIILVGIIHPHALRIVQLLNSVRTQMPLVFVREPVPDALEADVRSVFLDADASLQEAP